MIIGPFRVQTHSASFTLSYFTPLLVFLLLLLITTGMPHKLTVEIYELGMEVDPNILILLCSHGAAHNCCIFSLLVSLSCYIAKCATH